jgi:AcrR family transcriptional regulator
MAGTKDPSSTRRRAPLTRERVLRAALQLADKNGIDAVSMRRLAQKLGVEAMSLYNHVANKDEVLDGITDMVVGEIEVPAIGADWKAAMRRRAISAHEVLMRHPWAPLLVVSRMNIGPAMLRYVNATLGCLREAGFSYAMADHAWNAIDSHVYGFTLQKLNFPLNPAEYASAARGFLPMLPESEYPYMRALTMLVSEGKHRGLHDFEFGLDLILDGLEQLRDRSG